MFMFKCLLVSLNARPVPECLKRCDLNKMLSIKYVSCKKKEMQKEKNGREEFKELNMEAVSER